MSCVAVTIETKTKIKIQGCNMFFSHNGSALDFASPQSCNGNLKQPHNLISHFQAYLAKFLQNSLAAIFSLSLIVITSSISNIATAKDGVAKWRGDKEYLEHGAVLTDEELNFSIKMYGNRWQNLPIGTLSNGEGDLEINGHFQGSDIIVFDQPDRDTISNLVEFRISESIDELDKGAKCSQNRTFIEGTILLNAIVKCDGEVGNKIEHHVYRYLQKGSEHYLELYSRISYPKDTQPERELKEFQDTIMSFSILDLDRASANKDVSK